MMQFTQSAPPPAPLLHHNGGGHGLGLDLAEPDQPLLYSQRCAARPPWTGRSAVAFPTSSRALGSFNTAGCMEQLLVHCANAIDGNDATLAQQILWVLNNIAPPDGDSNQRLTSAFLRALVARASATGSCKILASPPAPARHHQFSALDLANFVDLTPWHRFGYTASNAAILDAVEGSSVVHIVDLGTTHCMQIPTLIDALASRPEGPPVLRLTVPSATANSPPPMLDISYDELGSRLVNFARSRNIPMEFQVVHSSPSDGFSALIDQLRVQQLVSEGGEALVVNCQMLLHYIPDETAGAIATPPVSLRSMFLKAVRSLEPALVTVADEDADFTATDVVSRLRSAFNYLWIPYDAVDTFLPKGSEQRKWYEAGLGWRIEDVIAREGLQRVERLEQRGRWAQRMRGAGFRGVAFGEEAAAEVKGMLDEHAAGWGMKREEDGDLVLTWKGHNVVFATAWVPS
ncbi:Scarecrow-like protein 32 [Ananas comosus]|uniref:Scarecrow-like protein 32 n=1 Tax=Ananas comosus TaxID=4615 RepID=A0A199VGJ3_ANACO|nr:Scarecrow-like protein 32 [Ananas comosus]